METKRTSSIIKRIDQYLLKNKPVTWSSRIHAAMIYGLGFALLLALISFIVPNDPRNEIIIHYWITLVSIISLLAFIFWMIYLLRFNVFKRYGKWKSTDTLKTFILYFIISLVIISWPFIPPVIESIRANAKYTSDELARDINDMNIKVCQIERDSIDRTFDSDTFHLRNNVLRQEKRYVTISDSDTVADYVTPTDHYYYIDTAELKSKLVAADSVKKLNDSIYVIYECPDYTFVYDYNLNVHIEAKLLSSMDLYRQVLRYKPIVDKEKILKELNQLLTKYAPNYDHLRSRTTDYTLDNFYGEKYYLEKIRDKYHLYSVSRRLSNISEKMYRWDEESINTGIRIIFYITLCLSMLVLIYRHTTRRTFFLSLLAATVLSILTGLFIAMMPYPRTDNTFFISGIAYFILFMILSAFIFISKTRNVVHGISLNLLVFMTPFMPLIVTGLYYRSLRHKYGYRHEIDPEEYYRLFKNEKLHFLLSEIGGFLLLIILLATLYQMAYKKWYSLPEQ